MFMRFQKTYLQSPSAMRSLALAAGFIALGLAGCGGGSGNAPFQATIPAPSNFRLTFDTPTYGTWTAVFRWNATPGATRYELYADPDAGGPLSEIKIGDTGKSPVEGFGYSYTESQGFMGYTFRDEPLDQTARLNATYRLRACDATGCGAFTESKSLDVVNDISHAFASGRVPLRVSVGSGGSLPLSKDGLTLVIAGRGHSSATIFVRNHTTQPWQQAVLDSGKGNFGYVVALSADGNTLAVQSNERTINGPYAAFWAVYIYQRTGSAWSQQAYLDATSVPPNCPQPCQAYSGGSLALSADGNLLAIGTSIATADSRAPASPAVFTYVRTGVTWGPQAYLDLDTGGKKITSMVLSSDGSTLAVNEGGFSSQDNLQSQTTTPFVRIFVPQGNSGWTEQARIPSGTVNGFDVSGFERSAVELSGDGNTLAVHARNTPGHPNPALDLQAPDLSCGSLATDGWYVALYTREGSNWQRQTAISRGLRTSWALASDGNALWYGGEMFTRSSNGWTCH